MRTLFLFLALFLALGDTSSYAGSKALEKSVLMSGATTTGAGLTGGPINAGYKSYQASVTGTGTVTATVTIEVTNDSSNLGWITLGTITLSGTTTATDGFISVGSWAYVRANVTAITGTGAYVNAISYQE